MLTGALALLSAACLAAPTRPPASPAPGATVEQATGEWGLGPPMGSARSEIGAAAIDQRIYVAGGFVDGGVATVIEAYDVPTAHWGAPARLPTEVHHPGVAAADGKLYVAGGFDAAGHPLRTLWEYDPKRGAAAVTARRLMPTLRGALALVELGGRLHAIGGINDQGNTGAHEVYDPATDTWQSLPPLPTPRDHLAAVAHAGRIYVFGGRLGDFNNNVGVTEIWDPVAGRWLTGAPMPTPRSGIAAAAVAGRIYVSGGETGSGTFAQNEAYDPATNRWSAAPPMPQPRHGHAAVTLGGVIYVIAGGPTPGGSYSRTLQTFKP